MSNASRRNFEKARFREKRRERAALRKLGAITEKRTAYVTANQARLKREMLERLTAS